MQFRKIHFQKIYSQKTNFSTVSSLTRVTSVKYLVGILTHQSHISTVMSEWVSEWLSSLLERLVTLIIKILSPYPYQFSKHFNLCSETFRFLAESVQKKWDKSTFAPRDFHIRHKNNIYVFLRQKSKNNFGRMLRLVWKHIWDILNMHLGSGAHILGQQRDT